MVEVFDAPLRERRVADIAHLIEPVIPALRRYARTFVRDTGTADDLVQDALERADMQATAIPMITHHTSAKKQKQRQAMHNHSSLALLLSASSGSSANRLMMNQLIVTCVSRVTAPLTKLSICLHGGKHK
jgi:hypothetical protein